jgi:hypothetical protein
MNIDSSGALGGQVLIARVVSKRGAVYIAAVLQSWARVARDGSRLFRLLQKVPCHSTRLISYTFVEWWGCARQCVGLRDVVAKIAARIMLRLLRRCLSTWMKEVLQSTTRLVGTNEVRLGPKPSDSYATCLSWGVGTRHP